MALKKTASDAYNNWRTGVQGGGAKYTAGVARSGDWAAAATAPAAVQARNAGLTRAIANGDIERGIANLGTTNWRNITQAKSANWSNAVNSPVAQANAQQGFQKLFGMLNTALGELSGMPRGGLEENLARSATFARSMNAQKQANR